MTEMLCSCELPDGEICAPLRIEPLDAERTTRLAVGFKALGDPHRVQILHLLAAAGAPVCVVDIERHVSLAQSTISHHLNTLVDAGVLLRERRGKWSFYSIVPDVLVALGTEAETLAERTKGVA